MFASIDAAISTREFDEFQSHAEHADDKGLAGGTGEIAEIESLALKLLDAVDAISVDEAGTEKASDVADRFPNTEFERRSSSDGDDGEPLVDHSDTAPALQRRSPSDGDMGPSKPSGAALAFDMSAFAVDGVYDRKLALDELDDWLHDTGFEEKIVESERRSSELRHSCDSTRSVAPPSSATQQLCPSKGDRCRPLPPAKTKEIGAQINDRRVSVDELDDWLHGTCFEEEKESGRRSSEPDTAATSRGVKRRQVPRRNNSVPDETTEAVFYRPSRPKKLKLKSTVPLLVPSGASGSGVRGPVKDAPKSFVYESDKQTCSRYFLGVMAERDADVLLPQVRFDRQAPGNADWLPWPRMSPLQRCLREPTRQVLYNTGQDVLRKDQASQHFLQTRRSMQGLSSGGRTDWASSSIHTQGDSGDRKSVV